jgi:hypothetical protein
MKGLGILETHVWTAVTQVSLMGFAARERLTATITRDAFSSPHMLVHTVTDEVRDMGPMTSGAFDLLDSSRAGPFAEATSASFVGACDEQMSRLQVMDVVCSAEMANHGLVVGRESSTALAPFMIVVDGEGADRQGWSDICHGCDLWLCT